MTLDYCECVTCGHIHDGKVTAIEDIVNRLAAREKRMREVAEELLARKCPSCWGKGYNGDGFICFECKGYKGVPEDAELAAKLLEGLGAE